MRAPTSLKQTLLAPLQLLKADAIAEDLLALFVGQAFDEGVGEVEHLLDEGGGALTIVLSPSSIAKFAALITAEVQARAMAAATATKRTQISRPSTSEIQTSTVRCTQSSGSEKLPRHSIAARFHDG